jgi:hypothetical protein
MNYKELKRLGEAGLYERVDKTSRDKAVDEFNILVFQLAYKKNKEILGISYDLHPDKNVHLYNSIGVIYPQLNKQQKKIVVLAHLRQFKPIEQQYVNHNHTRFIREPLLLADISAASKSHYWPGFGNESNLWEDEKSFSDLENEIMENGLFKTNKVKSDFLAAYGLLCSDVSKFGGDFIKAAQPEFLNRVLEGIVTVTIDGNRNRRFITKEMKSLRKRLPKLTHEKLEEFKDMLIN